MQSTLKLITKSFNNDNKFLLVIEVVLQFFSYRNVILI